MISTVLILAAAALISQHSGIEANTQVETSNLSKNVDNNLWPNGVPPTKKQRRLRKYVRIFTHPEEEIRRGVGEQIELTCMVMGYPLPMVRWEKNGQTVFDVEELNEVLPVKTQGIGRLTSKLILSSATPGEDQYSCIATAGVHTDSFTTTVYTLPSEDSEDDLQSLEKLYLPTKPTITYYNNALFQDIGTVVVVPCRIHSLTKSQVFWYDSSERFVRDNTRMRVLPSGDLVINGLRWSDMGNFTCTAKNLYGKASISTFVYPIKGV